MAYIVLAFLILVGGLVIYVLAFGPKLPPETDTIIDRVLTSELPELVGGQTGFAESGGIKIWYEKLSPNSIPKATVLLMMSNAGNALDWPPSFVRAFVDAGYEVIRYDHRGTGLSDWIENWDRKNPYTLRDMAADAVAVLDAVNTQKAHVVGVSLGGMIAQEVAINYPDRVQSLTLMMTTGNVADPELPTLSSRYFLSAIVKGLPLLKYRFAGGEKNLIKERVAKTISVVGDEGLDIKEMAEVVLFDLRKRKGVNVKAIFQHQAAVTISEARYDKLKTVNVPTLVIHGTADQIIPVEHGRKLVQTIPDAKGVWLEGVGHIFPYPNMSAVNKQIFAHIDSAV